MSVPDWRTVEAGTRVRVALWLHSEVGEGGTFTKSKLREAFPGVEQIDRRMRDLRPEGWIITTYQGDRSLGVDELRLVREGGAVWESDYRSSGKRPVSARERSDTMQADDYACILCGIGGGEVFPDDPLRTAKLSVVRKDPAGDTDSSLVTVCDRCISGAKQAPADDLIPEIEQLSAAERDNLASWVKDGHRSVSKEERLWARFRRLSPVDRKAVESHLDSLDDDSRG